jgi:tetratricopeptide (TPR) repeat protein
MKQLLLFFIPFISLAVAIFSSKSISIEHVKDFVAPPPLVEHYGFGFKSQLADLLWIRSIQDFDFCESQIVKNTCKGKSWLFQMINSVVDLDPNYLIAYSAGGLALTILISDYAGASVIFDKGVVQYPNSWPLLYRAAYHVLYEEKNFEKAALLYERAAKNGGPDWLPGLAKRLREPDGRLQLAERMLSDMYRRKEDEIFINKMKEKVEALKLEAQQSDKATQTH